MTIQLMVLQRRMTWQHDPAIALPIQPGQAVDVREHVFMVATGQVAYDWFNTGIWFSTKNGDDTETHYPLGMFMDRFSATSQPGLLLLHAAGNAFVRGLAQGETILVKPTALLFKDTTVGNLVAFMHTYSLRFAPATTPKQRAIYRDLLPQLVEARDKPITLIEKAG